MSDGFTVTFWGTRGSLSCPGPSTIRYGGNTSCVEMSCGGHSLVFDAGTGLRSLGKKMMMAASDEPDTINMFLTHTHLDHVVGLPFFGPLHRPGNKINLWAGHLLPNRTLTDALNMLMSPPLFPVPPAIFRSDVTYKDFEAGETITLPEEAGVVIKTAPLNHPNGATGYRVEYDGKAVCYITDTEHVPGKPDQVILNLIKDADLVIYDSSYTEEEFKIFMGFGHSTWEEGVRLCDQANVKQLYLFHHDPSHDDEKMDEILADAQKLRPNGVDAAREGETITLS